MQSRHASATTLLVPLLIVLAGCTGQDGDATNGSDASDPPDLAGTLPPITVSHAPTPAADHSGEPNMAVGPDGFYLSWLERTGESRHALKFSRWEGNGWSDPGTVMDRENLFVNWADFPSLVVLDDGTMAAHWLEKSGPGTYAYDVRMAISTDGGETWSEDVIPHTDGLQAEHGFVSLFPVPAPSAADDGPGQAGGSGQAIGAVWLDGRATVEGDPMTLRYATIARDGSLHEGTRLDASVCDCCQTGAALSDAGPVVAYRDRTEGEVRDIYVTRLVDGVWTDPALVHDDGWVIPGCPVNGPSVDAAGERAAVGWFTGAPDPAADAAESAGESTRQRVRRMGENGRVLVAFSNDAGATFGEPVRVDDGAAMGRVSVKLLDDGSALVVWLERVEGRAEIRIRQVNEAGAGESMALTATAAARASGFPRMARDGDRLMFAWTEPGAEPGQEPVVRTATAMIGESEGRLAGSGR